MTTVPETTPPTVDINDPSSCVVATWALLGDQIANMFTQGAFAALPLDVAVDGQGILDIRADSTFTYTPGFTIRMSLNGSPESTGSWSGVIEGTWSLIDGVLTLAHTSNTTTGSIEVSGLAMDLGPIRAFNGVGRVASCAEETLTVEIDAPTGTITHTLVLA